MSSTSDYARRLRNKSYVYEYLQEHPCITCGEADIRVLDFDHRDPSLKSFGIHRSITNRYSIAKIAEEIKKCDVLCSNCHRRKTAHENNWYSHQRILEEMGE